MLSLLLLTLSAAPAPTPPMKLAALEWAAVHVERDLAAFFSDELARALRAQGLKVVTPSEIAAVIGLERQRALMGCSESERGSCLAELGNALGCDGTLLVSVAKLSGSFRANVKVLSSRDGTTIAETSVESDSDKGFARELDGAAERIASAIGRPAVEVRAPPPSLRSRALIPAVSGGVVAVAGGVLVGLAFQTSSSLDTELRTRGLTGHALELASQGRTLQLAGWAGVGLGVAALAVAAGLFLFGADSPVQPAVSVTPQGASFGLVLEWR